MSAPSITRLARRPCVRARALHGSRPFLAPVRSFAQSPARAWPRKDSQDKDSINTEATEYSKSGTDDAAAQQDEAAFDPSTTDPQKEKKIAGEGNEGSGNPLEVSPANPEVSKPKDQQESAANKSAGKERQSGAGSPNKAGKP